MKTIRRILRSPLARQVIAWGAPIVIGWVMTKLDKSAQNTKKNSSKKRR